MENHEVVPVVTISNIGWLEFILRVVEAIAWPSLILILALLYGKKLISMLPNIERLSLGSVEAVFKKIEDSREAAEEISSTDRGEATDDLLPIQKYLAELDEAAVGVIFDVNDVVDKEMYRLQEAVFDKKFDKDHKSPAEVLKYSKYKIYIVDLLQETGWLSDAEAEIARNLKYFRTGAMEMGQSPVTIVLARQSIELASTLLKSISAKINKATDSTLHSTTPG